MKRALTILFTALSIAGLGLQTTALADEHGAETLTGDKAALEKISTSGPVQASVRLSPTQPVIGDALTLTLEVIAEPGVELLMPEFGQSLDRFAILDFLPRERLDEQGRTLATQQYTLQAPLSGAQYIPRIMIEFVDRRPGQRPAPQGEDAYELLTERLPFEVQSLTPSAALSELKPALGELAPIATDKSASRTWLLALLLALAALAPFGWRYWRLWRARTRQRSAFDIASARLRQLQEQERPQAQTMKPFFMDLSDIIRRYLEDRFALHAPELTTEEFLDIAAASPDLNAQQQGFLREFLQSADRVKFARHIPDSTQVEDALTAAERFLAQTREPQAAPARTEASVNA